MGFLKTDYYLGFSYMIPFEKLTWEQARRACFRRGYYLAHIESEGELDLIRSLILNNQGILIDCFITNFHILYYIVSLLIFFLQNSKTNAIYLQKKSHAF